MIIYSVTINIDADIAQEWLQWMLKVHIPDVLKTGCFTGYKIHQLLHPPADDKKSITYNIHYFCPDENTLQCYFENFAPKLQEEHKKRYEGKFVAIRTILKEITQNV